MFFGVRGEHGELDLCELPTGLQTDRWLRRLSPPTVCVDLQAPCSKSGWRSPHLPPAHSSSLCRAAGTGANQVTQGLAPQLLQSPGPRTPGSSIYRAVNGGHPHYHPCLAPEVPLRGLLARNNYNTNHVADHEC